MEWEARMTEELETALNSGEMRRALEILAEMKGRGMRLRVICDESKSQESTHSPFPFAPPPYVGDSFRSRHDQQETPSWRSKQQGLPGKVEAFEIEERPAVVCSPVKVPSGFERPGPFRPQEKAREDSTPYELGRPAPFRPQEKAREDSTPYELGRPALFRPQEKSREGSVRSEFERSGPFRPPEKASEDSSPSGLERPALFRPQEKSREDSLHSELERPYSFKPQEKLRKDSSSPGSSPHSLLKPTPPPSWLKPKQQAVQEFQTVRSEFSSVSYSKLP